MRANYSLPLGQAPPDSVCVVASETDGRSPEFRIFRRCAGRTMQTSPTALPPGRPRPKRLFIGSLSCTAVIKSSPVVSCGSVETAKAMDSMLLLARFRRRLSWPQPKAGGSHRAGSSAGGQVSRRFPARGGRKDHLHGSCRGSIGRYASEAACRPVAGKAGNPCATSSAMSRTGMSARPACAAASLSMIGQYGQATAMASAPVCRASSKRL